MDGSHLSPKELRQMALRDFETALGGLRVGSLAPGAALDGESFAGLAHDDRRAVIDAIHDIGMKPVYEGNTPDARKTAHLSLDEGVRTAKWRFILSLVNEAYGLGYDYLDLEMMAPLCAQLGTIERGATNPHMPTTHKLRHNPMVHSVHVAGLVKEVFDGVAEQYPEDGLPLRQMQRQLMRAAIVHDMGELEGELSVATSRKNMSGQEVEQFEHRRGEIETEVFGNALLHRVDSLRSKQWPVDTLKDKTDSLLNDYSVAEDSNAFMGRAHKLVERMQSQQDYLRFEGLDMAPPQRVVVGDYHKDFMRGYALEPMNGTSNGEKTKPALAELAVEHENPELAQKVVKELEGRLSDLQQEIERRLEYRPRTFAERLTEGVRMAGGQAL